MPVLFLKQSENNTNVGVWHITENVNDLINLVNISDIDLKTLESYKHESRKKHWLSYRAMINELVKENYNIVYTDFGKPFLQINNKNEHLSITHSGEYSAVIINPALSVGIDIEKISKRIERVVSKFLSDEEQEFIDNENFLAHLTICWTAKEALFKIHGNTCYDFDKQIKLSPFNYSESGEIDSTIILENKTYKYKVNYYKINEYFLALVTDTN